MSQDQAVAARFDGRTLAPHALLALLCLAAYGPALWGSLAHPDDISVLRFHLQDGISWWQNGWTTCGRWLQGALHLALLPWLDGLEDFRIYRWFGFLGLVVWNFIFERRLCEALPAFGWRWLVVTAVALSPAFAVFVTQAHFADLTWAAVLALWAGEALRRLAAGGSRGRARDFLLGGACLAVSLHLHQGLVGMGLIPTLLACATGSLPPRALLRAVGLYLAALVAYWLYFNAFMAAFFPHAPFAARGAIPLGLAERPAFFVQQSLLPVARGWTGFQGGFGATAVVLLALALSLGWGRRLASMSGPWHRVWVLAFLLALPVLMAAPQLAARDLFPAFRLYGPLTVALVLIMALGGHALSAQPISGRLQFCARWVPQLVAALWLGLQLAPLHEVLHTRTLEPLAREYAMLESFVRQHPEVLDQDTAYLFPAVHGQPLVKYPLGEYGWLNSVQPWVPAWYLQSLAQRPIAPGVRQENHPRQDAALAAYGVWVDFDVLLDPGLAALDPAVHARPHAELPHFGRSYALDAGWRYAPCLGRYRPTAADWMEHAALGPLYGGPAEAGGQWMHHAERGWLWLSPQRYPFAQQKEPAEAVPLW